MSAGRLLLLVGVGSAVALAGAIYVVVRSAERDLNRLVDLLESTRCP